MAGAGKCTWIKVSHTTKECCHDVSKTCVEKAAFPNLIGSNLPKRLGHYGVALDRAASLPSMEWMEPSLKLT